MTVLEMLQLCLIGQRSGRIDCQMHGHPKGYLEIRAGQVVHASSGVTTGEPAFFALVTTPGIQGHFLPHDGPVERNVSVGTDFLLMEAARRADEMAKNTPPPPPVAVSKISVSQLTVISDPVPKVFELGAPTIRVGRALDNDIILPVDSVSGHHCWLELKSTDYWIADCGSRNGTYVNNRKVVEPTQLQVGDLIQLGAALLRCGGENISAAATKPRTAKIHLAETQELMPPPRKPGGAPSAYQAVNLPPRP
jgi:hypothetical protein